MGRSEQPVPDGPLKEFAEGLRALRHGEKLTYRQLSQRARYSYSVLSTAASGRELPTLDVTLAYVRACKGDATAWEERWKSAAAALRHTGQDPRPSEEHELAPGVDQQELRAPSASAGGWHAAIEPPGQGSPRRIGAFRVLGRLGDGATAEVYLAAGPSGRAVAVKVIRAQFARDPLFRRRFARELAAARTVQGTYSAAVVGADPHAERPWMASEYLPGPSLAQVVANNGPLPARVVLAMAAGIAEALRVFHAAGVVHRDLKPTNVILTGQGPKVIDFGIAQCFDGTTLTATGVQLGTAGFTAPEQAEGRRVTPAADIFALGCTLAVAATGRSPFGDGASTSVLYRIVHNEPDEEALACADKQLRDLIKRCLSKDPERRPAPEQIVAQCAGLTLTEPGWLPGSIAAQAARLDATAAALVKRAARRWTVRRLQAASAALVLFAAIVATGAAILGEGANRGWGGSRAADAPSSSVAQPGLTATPTPAGNAGIVPVGRHKPADAFGVIGQAAGAAGPPVSSIAPGSGHSPSRGPGEVTPAPALYSFEDSTDGWGVVGGAKVVSSPLYRYDGMFSLELISTVADAGHVADVAVSAPSKGPAAGTTVAAWVYVPVNATYDVQAMLYVKDVLGVEHEPKYIPVPPGVWYRLTYATAGYGGRAQVVGVRFDEFRSVGATVYLDAVSWG